MDVGGLLYIYSVHYNTIYISRYTLQVSIYKNKKLRKTKQKRQLSGSRADGVVFFYSAEIASSRPGTFSSFSNRLPPAVLSDADRGDTLRSR